MKRTRISFTRVVNTTLKFSFGSFLFASLLLLASCSKNDDNNPASNIKPSGPKPAWGPTITPQMQTVVEKLMALTDTTPIHELTPAQARMAPSAADAAMAVMNDYKIPAPPMNVDTMGVEIPVSGGSIHARIYTPKTSKTSYPVVVYYHGGGFVIATVDTYNSSAQALAEMTDAVVVSVEYRKGPEFKFPTAHNDAYEAYKWVLANAGTMKGDTAKIAVAGESAGGNLAANVSMKAAADGIKVPLHQVLVYPVADNNLETPSMNTYADAVPLGKADLQWFYGYYLNNISEGNDPRLSLVDVADLSKMPPTTIIAAEIDPLQTEGKLLADKLVSLNINTTYKLYTGVTHEFFGMNTVIPEAKEAETLAASQLKNAFK